MNQTFLSFYMYHMLNNELCSKFIDNINIGICTLIDTTIRIMIYSSAYICFALKRFSRLFSSSHKYLHKLNKLPWHNFQPCIYISQN